MCFAPFRCQLHHIAIFLFFIFLKNSGWHGMNKKFSWKRKWLWTFETIYQIAFLGTVTHSQPRFLFWWDYRKFTYSFSNTHYPSVVLTEMRSVVKTNPWAVFSSYLTKKNVEVNRYFIAEGKIHLSLFLLLKQKTNKTKQTKDAECEVLTFNCIRIVIV